MASILHISTLHSYFILLIYQESRCIFIIQSSIKSKIKICSGGKLYSNLYYIHIFEISFLVTPFFIIYKWAFLFLFFYF